MKKLPDKGEKARKTREMVESLIKAKEKVEVLEDEMKKMKIDTEKMEWKGSLLDSDDDSDPEEDVPAKNPLSVLAQGVIPKKFSKAQPEQESNTSTLSDVELFAIKEAEKVDNLPSKASFVPFKSIRITSVDEDIKRQFLTPKALKSQESKRISSPKPKTPAIPLPSVYVCQTKKLSLTESLKLQQDQDKKLREIQMKHAADKLKANNSDKSGQLFDDVKAVGGQFEEYRNQVEEENELEEAEDDDDGGVGVVGIAQSQTEEE